MESKTCLDGSSSKDTLLDCFVKPPANLVVLEGDCLDSSGDAGELESYLVHGLLFICIFIFLRHVFPNY